MMCRLPIALLAAASCMPRATHPGDDESLQTRGRPNVDAARELDQEGVRAFREGRYADALRYFRGAYWFGGPSSELWNVARCRERLDDGEGASAAIDEYLARHDLSPSDRAGAAQEQQALSARPSTLTVTTMPTGASVTLDGKQGVGRTPLSVEVSPGSHTMAVRRDGYSVETRAVEAHFGRAVIVSLDLAPAGK
jgi:hypothetical protein